MLQQISNIVARARARKRLSVEALARDARVDVELVSRLERGVPGISTAELDRIAERLDLDGAALLLGEERDRPRTSVFLRHAGVQDFDYSVEANLDLALEAGRTLISLNDRLGRESGPRRRGAFLLRDARREAAQDGYDLARRLRRVIDVPADPLGDLGMLIEECLEIALMVMPLGSEKLSAVSVRDAEGAAAIVLNAHEPQWHQNPQLVRVYLAHELCHVLHDPSSGGLHLVIDRTEDTAEAAQQQHVERAQRRAKAFAAELLLPLQGLVDLLGTPTYTQSEAEGRNLVTRARQHFSTPWEIAVNHLNHQGFVSDDVRLLLLRQRNAAAPPSAVATRLPDMGRPSVALLDRVRLAHDEGLVTDGQARAAIGLAAGEPLPWT